MNTVELRHQINQWLDQLSPEHLALVANFVDFLNQKQLKGVIISQNNLSEVVQTEIPESIPKANSSTQGSTLADLLEFAGIWEGDDLRECLKWVHQSRLSK
ncbi:MAG: hypothetical protein F6K14_04480 [Symploca sp. SIO2C1]|nr:hypothetical protein [Symploca sp. SIO2C1]